MALTLRQVEAFRAVMIAGTVVRAAELLHVSQPAVSRLVADMEREVGYALFNRERGRLVVTEEGKLLFAEVQRAFVGLSQIDSAAQSIGAMQTGHLRIVSMPLLAGSFLPRVINAFLAEHARVTISLEIQARHLVLDWVAMQQFDLGFATLPVEDPAIHVQVLATEEAVCLVPAQHHLARKPVLHVRDLKDEPFVAFPPESLLRLRVDEVFSKAGVRRRLRVEARTAEAVRHLVAGGAGITVLTLFDVAETLPPGVVVRPFRPALPIQMGVLSPAHKAASRMARRFAETAHAVYLRDRARAAL